MRTTNWTSRWSRRQRATDGYRLRSVPDPAGSNAQIALIVLAVVPPAATAVIARRVTKVDRCHDDESRDQKVIMELPS